MSSKHQEGRPPVYDNSFKVAVAREYLIGNQGYGTLAKKHGLTTETVRHFVRWYKANYDGTSVPPEKSSGKTTNSEVELLRKQLEEANLKVAGLEIMIEVAKKELGIDVKKFGAKQSRK